MTKFKIENSSFRDTSGFLFHQDDILYRLIHTSYKEQFDHLINSELYKKLSEKNLLIAHEEISDLKLDYDYYKIIKPEKIPFISYPYEWSFSQLKDAALLTLRIQKGAMKYGMTLKDASAYNIQFFNGKPIFIDTLSFEIYEDGVQQNVTFFTKTQLPIALALLIDTSASMDEKMATAQEAAIGFSQRLRPEDLAEIVDFDSRVNILQTFTNDPVELEQAIQRTSAGDSTSLYNAIYISLRELSKAPLQRADVRREAIIVLSDGEDTSSLVTFDEVLEQAKRSETAIYSIGLQSDDSRS